MNDFEFAYFSFLLSEIRSYRLVVLYPFTDKNGAKTRSLGAAHTNVTYILESSPEGSAVRAKEFLYPVQK